MTELFNPTYRHEAVMTVCLTSVTSHQNPKTEKGTGADGEDR